MQTEWLPREYLLQIRHNKCMCGNVETASDLWLIQEHIHNDATNRKPAVTIDHRLPRGTSERTVNVSTCSKCFTPYTPVRITSDEELILVHPGDPNKRLIKSLEDII